MDNFLRRVMEARHSEQMEAAAKPEPERTCDTCGRVLGNVGRRAIHQTCWPCRERDWKTTYARRIAREAAKVASPH